MSGRAAVAATSPLAAQAGLDVVHAGGSAVDAAIAAMVLALSTEPGVVSAMAGGYVNVWGPGDDPVVIDGNVEMPGRGLAPERFGQGLREFTTSYGGGITVHAGHGSAATAGIFAGFAEAHSRFGAVPWAELISPAIHAVRDGYPLGTAAASYLALVHDSIFGWDPQTRAAISRPDGAAAQAGDTLRVPDLAASLEHIARQGAASLYTGDLADQIVQDMSDRGGLVTAADLTAYRAVTRPALMTRLGGWTLATNPPPSIGGPVLTALLRLVAERAPCGAAERIAIQQAVLGYRLDTIDVARDLQRAGTELLAVIRERGLPGPPTSASTAHISVVDGTGMACAITASAGYGSGATVPGTGLMLNNCLGEPELNRRGLHALSPGTRLASNMAPTTGVHHDSTRLAIGTPGADRITTALMQVLTHYCLEGMGIQEAIDAPRLHVRRLGDGTERIDLEQDPALIEEVAASGLPTYLHDRHAMFFGGVGAAVRTHDGALLAAGDPRRAAATATG